MEQIKISLPIPPSVNQAYTDRQRGAGRAKSARAVQFTVDALKSLYDLPKPIEMHCQITNNKKDELIRKYMRDHPGAGMDIPKILLAAIWAMPITDRPGYHVEVEVFFKDASRPRDIMNFEKLATDFLVDRGFILDDCLIEVFTIRRGPPDPSNPRLEYTIKIFG